MHVIEVGTKSGLFDALGEGVKNSIAEDLGITGVKSVRFLDVYNINAELGEGGLNAVAEKVLSDPISQSFSVNSPLDSGFDWEITVKYNPDVTDNVGFTAKKAIEDFLGKELGRGDCVRSARKYLLRGKISREDAERICKRLLANAIVEVYEIREGAK